MADDEKAEAAAPSLEDRVTALTRQLDEERTARKLLEDTLGALRPETDAGRGAPAQARSDMAGRVGFGGLSADARERLKTTLGWNDQDIQSHWHIIQSFLEEMAAPLVGRIDQLFRTAGDALDRHDAVLSIPEYKDLADDVEKEQRIRLQRGDAPMSRKELFHMIRARKLPELVEKAAKERLEQERQQQASAAAAETETGTVAQGKVGPAAGKAKTPGAPTEAELAGLPRDERIKKLEEYAGTGTF